MKICIVNSEPSRLPRVHLMRKTLSKAGYEPTILQPAIQWRFRPKFASAGIRYSTLMAQEFIQSPDAYHVMNIPDILALPPVLKKCRFVYDVRSPWAEEMKSFHGSNNLAVIADRLERYATKHADIVITVNRTLKRRALEWGAKSVYLVPNYPPQSFAPGISPAKFKQDKGLLDRKVVLFVGKFSAVECTIDLVKMLGKIVELVPSAVLVMVGDGPQRQEIEWFARKHNLANSLLVTGWISYEEVPNWISIADVCLLPRRENMPSARFYSPHSVRKVGEYLSLGKQVIATPVGEFIHTELPIIVTPMSDFPQAISNTLQHPTPLLRPKDFNWENTEEVILQAYYELECLR